MATTWTEDRRWKRPWIFVELLLAVGAAIAGLAMLFADLSERQDAILFLYIWVLMARSAVLGYLSSRRKLRAEPRSVGIPAEESSLL